MKKVILCAGALLFGSFAFAQVNGSAPTADETVANHSTDATANRGETIQEGNANKVRVRQAGTRNSVYTNQDDGSGIGGNLGDIIQTGEVSGISGVANEVELRQSGSRNQSSMYQQGDRNNAVTLQGQNEDDSSNNRALISQGNNGQAERNFAAIEQDGDRNQATTNQRWDNNDAWTRQNGDRNGSMITQTAPPENSAGHAAISDQLGDRNEATITQTGAGARNTAEVSQFGDRNQAKQMQTATDAAANMGNTGYINQGYNFGGGIVSFPGDSPLISNLVADINANVAPGFFPVFVSSLESEGAKAKQIQNGKLQEAAINQLGGVNGRSNYAEQNQTSGWGNDAAIFQFSDGTGRDNYARQDQAGDNNNAGIGQNGNGHKALQTQDGHRNDALTAQVGSRNLSNTHQFGNENVGWISQDGTLNGALLTQRGGHSYTIDQTGMRNQADIYQGNPGDDFGSLIECDFDEQMNIDMDFTVPPVVIDDVCPNC